MILVDTSIWVNHLRRRDAVLAEHLEAGEVLCHPFVIGELSLGALKRRSEVLDLLSALPFAPMVSHDDAMTFARRAVALEPDNPRVHRGLAAIVWLHILFNRGAVTVDHYLGSISTSSVTLPFVTS